MLAKGLSIELISQVTEFPVTEIEKLKDLTFI
jgi:hypothetical protein